MHNLDKVTFWKPNGNNKTTVGEDVEIVTSLTTRGFEDATEIELLRDDLDEDYDVVNSLGDHVIGSRDGDIVLEGEVESRTLRQSDTDEPVTVTFVVIEDD